MYLNIAQDCEHTTGLKRCLHALIHFVYDRIAKERLEALRIMAQPTVRGIDDEKASYDAGTYFFDSKYLIIMQARFDDYSVDVALEICRDTAGSADSIAHLRGTCDRLLTENPGNPVLHAIHAYAIALSDYRTADVKTEIDLKIECFEKYENWSRAEKLRRLHPYHN